MKAGGTPSEGEGTETWSSDDAAGRGGGPGAAELDPARLGADSHYEFADVVGRGGVGVVIKARDRRLGRVVAIKLIPGKDPTVQARFEREAMLTARLQHPGIVPIYEAGKWPNGESYYAMRLIEGQPLSDLIAATTTLDERLALVPKVVAVAEAVAYAHTERVIHRDLKPKNVVVGAFGEVMVVDWGLAKDLSRAEPGTTGGELPPEPGGDTVIGAVMGTPAYMPPEQAAGAPVDERADVYALGAVLYSVLTGAAPFAGTSSADVLHQVQHVAPEPVQQRQPGVPRDLAAIVDKAMQREASERYADARELAADLKRFVTGQLVGAHHYSRRVLVTRAIRRHPVITAAAAFAVVLIGVGVIALRRIVAEQDATQSRSRALLLGQARATLESDPTAAVALLEHYPDRSGHRAETEAVRAIALDAESRGVARHVLRGHTGPLHDVAISPDGGEIASTDGDGALYLWSTATGAGHVIHQSTTIMDAVQYDPTGAQLAASIGPLHGVLLWDRRKLTSRILGTPEDDVYALAFSPDGALIVGGGSGGTVYVWSVATGALRTLDGHEAWVSTVAFSPDGTLVLTASQDGSARLWTVATGAVRVLPLEDQGYYGVFSPDGASVAVGSVDGTVRIWSVADAAAPARVLRGDRGAVDFLEYSHDGKRLAWAGMGEAVYVADLATATGEIRALHGHADDVTGLVFLADDSVLTASADGTLRRWDLATGLASVLRGHSDQVVAMAVSGDGRHLISGSTDRTVRVWSLPPAARTFVLKASRESDFRAPATNDVLYFAQDGHLATVLDLRTGAARTIDTPIQWARMAGNATGTQVVLRDGQRHVTLLDLATMQPRPLPAEVEQVGRVLDYTPDGTRVVFSGWTGLYVVDAATAAVRELPYPSGTIVEGEPKVGQLQISADGTRALTVGKDLTRWDLASGRGTILDKPPLEWPSLVVASADLGTIAAGAIGGLAVYDGGGWRRLLDTPRDVAPIAFSPDGHQLAAGDDGGGLRIWRLGPGGAADGPLELVGHTGPLRQIAFSADGRTLVSAGTDGAMRVWDVATGQELEAIRAHGGRAVEWAGFHGSEIVTAGRDGAIRAWPVPTRTPGPVGALLTELTTYRGAAGL